MEYGQTIAKLQQLAPSNYMAIIYTHVHLPYKVVPQFVRYNLGYNYYFTRLGGYIELVFMGF